MSNDTKPCDDSIYASMSTVAGRPMARKPQTGQQLAPELSDIVIYLQAIKFKVYNP